MALLQDLSRPLKVSIVGAGLGGLAAALALRRNGHDIQIFEASQNNTEIGAGVGVQANALRVLHHLGFYRENLKGNDYDGAIVFDAESGVGTTLPWKIPRKDDEPELHDLFCHRSDLHDELKRLAIGEGEGPPAQLNLDSKVTGCNPDAGTVTLANGETIHADVVIGADGIRSVVRTSILGHHEKARASGWSCFRCLFAADLNQLSDFDWLRDGIHGGRAIIWKGGPGFRMLFIYPVREGTLINFVGYFTDPDQDKSDWAPTATREDILDKFRDFHPNFLRILDLPVATPILKWQLKAMPLLPTWIRGHATLLGDSAHATLPLMGQGAAMAIEDAGVLGSLLPLGTTRGEVPARLAAYQTLRKERGEFVNSESVAQAAIPEKRGLYLRSQEMQSFVFEYDTIKIAQDYFTTHFSARNEGREL
ncbi:FAD/NAD(P)-binding domain-containing protein [Mycena galericulata]|nr:FAD/NAD(P)-binding domain-containing protein [Mycena galericulata]